MVGILDLQGKKTKKCEKVDCNLVGLRKTAMSIIQYISHIYIYTPYITGRVFMNFHKSLLGASFLCLILSANLEHSKKYFEV